MPPTTIDDMLAAARARLRRVAPAAALAAQTAGAALIDIRTERQCDADGVIPGATDLEGGFQAWRAAGLPVAPASG
jgi:rhodanese-related sulfurtransferase